MKSTRRQRLMPRGIPRWIRCYDNGGVDNGGSFDQYTVCYTGRCKKHDGSFEYRAMSEHPFHPQGFGQLGEMRHRHCDVNKWGFAPAMGRRNHLGVRIPFRKLPPDCRKLVISDYKEIWRIK